jgi:hypothetical protein
VYVVCIVLVSDEYHRVTQCGRLEVDLTRVFHKHTHKFGIQVPKTWGEAVKLDKENGNTLCQDAITKEMNNFRISFKVINGEEAIPPTYQ